MKQDVKMKLSTLLMAICLIMSNVTMAFAATPIVQAPSLTEINTEIIATAEYLKTAVSIDASSDFYNSSKQLILLLRSGINCSDLVDSYLSQISNTYINNGKLTLTDPLTDYAYLSIILALVGKDATDFNGFNLIEKYETAITNADQETLNSINPYMLPHLYTTAYAYSKDFKDSTSCLTKLKIAILSYANENGINYWGNSTDNNGFSLSGILMLYNIDNDVKKLVENAIKFSQTLLQSDGTSSGDFKWTAFPNSDSTSAALTLYSTYGQQDLAAKSYAGLITFKTSSVPGAYSYTESIDTGSIYSTVDALYSLISYRSIIANQSAPFDVSDKLAAGLTPLVDTETETSGIDLDIATVSTIDSAANVDVDTDTSATSPATSDSNITNLLLFITLMCSCGTVAALFIKDLQKNQKTLY